MNKLTVRDVEAGYGAVRALHGASIEVAGGETVALLGTNGNGKSTLMKCLMGAVRPTAGEIVLDIDGIRHDLARLSTEVNALADVYALMIFHRAATLALEELPTSARALIDAWRRAREGNAA